MRIESWRVLALAMVFAIAFSSCDGADNTVGSKEEPDATQTVELTILGGAPGGSFSPFATAVGEVATQADPNLEITVEASPGSVDNTRRVDTNPSYLGVAFASESYLGYHGQEVFADEGPKANLRAVTLLYIAYVQTVVLADSDIRLFADLADKTIATGKVGSGSAQTLERLGRSTGIWDRLTLVHKGAGDGVEALRGGEADVFQQLISVPNDAITQLTATNDVRMIDLAAPARASGFLEQYPFYQVGTIPAGAYGGKVTPVDTILMPTLLISHKDVPAETVYDILRRIYTPSGLQAITAATGGAAADMTVENAGKAFVIPLHEGAHRFWSEQGVAIPAHAMPTE